MRKIHTVLRLHFEGGLSRREIAKSQSISYGTVANYLHRAQSAGLTWPLPTDMGERELAAALFPERGTRSTQKRFAEPDFARVHLELKSVGMTKHLAWEEYRQIHPDDGYSYSQFCHRYLVWLQRQQRSMRQTHIAGEKIFVDYCGPTVPIVNPHTGECINAQIFVAVLGASNYTFACASASQKEADWIDAHIKAAEFFGGWSKLTIPDNLKSGVTKTHRYVPVLNASYEQWSDHYGTAIIPARPYKPKDKAKAENAVLVVERWILARLRHYTFFSLGELNTAIAELLINLNNRPFKKLPGCRRSLFEQIEQHTLQSLPKQRYEYQHVHLARVNIDYHIEYDKHYYSVPHMLVKTQVEVRATWSTSMPVVNVLPVTCVPTNRQGIPRLKSICRSLTAIKPTGHQHALNNGPVISARPRFTLSKHSYTKNATRNNPFALSWRYYNWPNNTTGCDSNGLVHEQSRLALLPEPVCSRFLKTVSTIYPPSHRRAMTMII